MKTLYRISTAVAAGLGLLTVLCATTAAQKSTSVTVTNTNANPVPTVATGTTAVIGTVGINNLPAVQSVSGTVAVSNFPSDQTVNGTVNVASLPAVQLTGSSSVSVANSVTAPVPVLHAEALSSFTAQALCNFNNSNECPAFSFYTVPSGKIAVIEFISAHCSIDSGSTLNYVHFVDADGFNVYGTPSAPAVAGSVEDVTFSQNVKGYADSTKYNGDSLTFAFVAGTSQMTGSDGCQGYVSGYL